MDSGYNPPSKANLKAWWNHFTFAQKVKKDSEFRRTDDTPHTVFGKPLRESLKYASVQISTANANGELYVWGYIPVVVAKCGLYLKENATEVPGTFRVNGSNKRMRELQAAFETPPRYGKDLNWKQETYTTHDVASVFRRYLTQMPEPVIPHDMYHHFRDALGEVRLARFGALLKRKFSPARHPYSQDEIISTYKRLIRQMPRPNQYLLLYVLDLLSVFARKSDKNLMTATNLAVIFRPGLISHPNHEMSPGEHALSQRVLEFLIEHQDWFMLDIPPLPAGSTIKDIDDTHVPSSDEEHSQLGGGWNLVDREKPRLPRRRTTLDRNGHTPRGTSGDGPMSPIAEIPRAVGIGVTRSRTLPSHRKGMTTNDGVGTTERGRVLRKQKRSSSQGRKSGVFDTPKG